MQFGHPDRLWLLLLVPAAAVFMIVAAMRAKAALKRFGSPELLSRAGMSVSARVRALKSILLLAAIFLMAFALAAPQWGATREKIERKGVDVAVVLDTSRSMDATDLAPSRLIRAKDAIAKLLDLMKGDRIALTVFAGHAITICPITLDFNAARMFLDLIDTDIVPEPGTDLTDALKAAALNLSEGSNKYKVIILISDGEDLEGGEDGPAKEAEELAKQGVIIHTIGVGTTGGSPIPQSRGDQTVDKRDSRGQIIVSKLDENTLRKIALAGNGKYRRLDQNSEGRELVDIYNGISGMDKKTFEEEYQVHYEDRFQWFVGAALLCLLAEALLPDRRRKNERHR